MKMCFGLTMNEVVAFAEVFKELFPEIDIKKMIPEAGKEKTCTIKNKKLNIETSESNEEISLIMDIEPEFVVKVCELLQGFTGNISSACKALVKHGKLLAEICGVTETIKKINGLVVGTDINTDGSPINQGEPVEDESDDEGIDKEESFKFETPIADMAEKLGLGLK